MEVIEHHRREAPDPVDDSDTPLQRWLLRPLLAWALWAAMVLALALSPGPTGWPAAAVLASGTALLLLQRLATRRRLSAENESRRQGSQAQARSAWLDAVSALSPNGVLVFERDREGSHRLVFTNPAFSQLFGLRPEELLGLSEPAADEWLAGLAAEDGAVPDLAPGDATLRLAGPPARVLQRSSREDARQRVYYFRDVTHETAVEQLKNEFLTTAAHELRTPLASVYGFSELLLDARLEGARREQVTGIVHRQAGVLKHLVDELLDLARLDAHGRAEFKLRHQDLRALCAGAVESFDRPDQISRIAVATGRQPVWVLADGPKLQRAIGHALSNALKFSPPDSSVNVTVQTRQHEARAWAVLSVRDQGMGMSPEQLARAFERFYRADASGHVLGAGLGLCIAQEVMTHHDGRVTLQSAPQQGCTVELWLPLAPETLEPALMPAAAVTS